MQKRIACFAVPLAVDRLSALLTRSSMNRSWRAINLPLSPSRWLFTVVWTILFVLMGIASYLEVSRKPSQTALTVYGAQFLFNFVWPISLFQSGTIPVCLYLVRDFGAALDYDRPVLSDIQDGGASHVAILRMRDLCRLSEFCHLSVKSTVGALIE